MGARGGSRKPTLGFACGKGAGGKATVTAVEADGSAWILACVWDGRNRGGKDDSEVASQSNGKEGTPALDGLFWPGCAPEKYEFYVNSLS